MVIAKDARRFSVVGQRRRRQVDDGRRARRAARRPAHRARRDLHQPGWTELPVEEFRAKVTAATSGDGWVVDGNYTIVRDIVWNRADTIVWLDFSRRVVTTRIVRRSFSGSPFAATCGTATGSDGGTSCR